MSLTMNCDYHRASLPPTKTQFRKRYNCGYIVLNFLHYDELVCYWCQILIMAKEAKYRYTHSDTQGQGDIRSQKKHYAAIKTWIKQTGTSSATICVSHGTTIHKILSTRSYKHENRPLHRSSHSIYRCLSAVVICPVPKLSHAHVLYCIFKKGSVHLWSCWQCGFENCTRMYIVIIFRFYCRHCPWL